MAASNTDATKGILMLCLATQAMYDAQMIGIMQARMVMDGYGDEARAAIRRGNTLAIVEHAGAGLGGVQGAPRIF